MVDIGSLADRRFGRYILQELIGSGATSVVYRAHDIELDRYVAFKVLSRDLITDLNNDHRFIQEAKILAKLEHPNIVPIYDYGQIEGIYFIVMRLLVGGSLEKHLRENNFTLEESATVLDQLAGALDYLHSQSVVHRDIKASNVLFDQHSNAYLADFGLAKILNITSDLTMTGRILGTPPYMAPELWRDDEATPSSDIYALGVLMYRAISGSLPFEANSQLALMRKHFYATPTPLQQLKSDVSPEIDSAVVTALAKKSEQRYSSARAFAQAFRGALSQPAGTVSHLPAHMPPTQKSDDGPTEIIPPTAPVTPSDGNRSTMKVKIIIGALLSLLLFSLVVVSIILLRGTGSSTPTPTPFINSVVNPTTLTGTPTYIPTPTSTNTPTNPATVTPTNTALPATVPTIGPYAPVTPIVTRQLGVLSIQQPRPVLSFNWKRDEILTICLNSNQFEGDFVVQAPNQTITNSQNENGTACIIPYLATSEGNYQVVVHSINGLGGQYSLKLTIYTACAPKLPIAIVKNNAGGALSAIRENSNTFSRLVSTGVPSECFAILEQTGNGQNDMWWKILAGDGRTGWIAGVLVTAIGNLSPTSTPTP